jgi:hypothetical protein
MRWVNVESRKQEKTASLVVSGDVGLLSLLLSDWACWSAMVGIYLFFYWLITDWSTKNQ